MIGVGVGAGLVLVIPRFCAGILTIMVDQPHFRTLLEAERVQTLAFMGQLRRSLTSVSEARWGSNVDDEHDPEGATIAFELSQASSHLQQSGRRAEEIEAALTRMDAGTYGVCAVCKEPIARGRLEARPWTPYCIKHAGGSAS